MYKLKTNSSAKKRFRKAGGKKVILKRGKAFRRHLMTRKSPKRLRQLRKGSYIAKVDLRNMLQLLPY